MCRHVGSLLQQHKAKGHSTASAWCWTSGNPPCFSWVHITPAPEAAAEGCSGSKASPNPTKPSQPCSAHALPRLVVDGTQDGLGAAIKVMSVGVYRQLQWKGIKSSVTWQPALSTWTCISLCRCFSKGYSWFKAVDNTVPFFTHCHLVISGRVWLWREAIWERKYTGDGNSMEDTTRTQLSFFYLTQDYVSWLHPWSHLSCSKNYGRNKKSFSCTLQKNPEWFCWLPWCGIGKQGSAVGPWLKHEI